MSQLRHRCVSLSESSHNKGMKEEQITTVFTRLKSVLKARASRVLMSEDDADDALQKPSADCGATGRNTALRAKWREWPK